MQDLLSKSFSITRIANSAVAGTSAVTSSVLDMQDWDGVCFVAALGDVLDTSVLTLTVNENTANSTSTPTPTAVTGGATTAFTASATTADNKMLLVDVLKNKLTKRYVYAVLTRATANAVVDGIFAIRYRGRSLPVTLDAAFVGSAQAAS